MPAYIVIGAQWGDEGKGKVIDWFAERTSLVARYAGGTNAGHTVVNGQGEFRLHLVPSGIFHAGVECVIGTGVVVGPEALVREIDALEKRGIEVARLRVSGKAHVVMPYHAVLDRLRNGHLGTTGQGIGPAYEDKAARLGLRVEDLCGNPRELKDKLNRALEEKNALLEKVYQEEPFDPEELFERCRTWGERILPFAANTERLARAVLERGGNVLLEGAQGVMLDLDHGTYPYVTSSSPTAGGALTGLGIGPRSVVEVIGVFKAYTSRVGAGPFPTELHDAVAERIRHVGQEYGTTTGRPRRLGWFDAPLARESALLNGMDWGVLTRLDVLEDLEEVKVCVGYQDAQGNRLDEFPDAPTLSGCTPVLASLEPWSGTRSSRTWEELPEAARAYVSFIEARVGIPMRVISVGPEREATIVRGKLPF